MLPCALKTTEQMPSIPLMRDKGWAGMRQKVTTWIASPSTRKMYVNLEVAGTIVNGELDQLNKNTLVPSYKNNYKSRIQFCLCP
jgi:hypothetical protein